MSPTSYLTAPPRGDPWWTSDCTGALQERQPGSADGTGASSTVGLMRLRLRRARVEPAASLPVLRTERALVALAIHAQQLDERLGRMEQQLQALAADERDLDVPTQDDLLEVRLHSARVSAELTQVAVELQARIDDLAVRMPAVVAEDRRQRRARTLAETIIDLSDSLDTTPVDLDGEPGEWAATA